MASTAVATVHIGKCAETHQNLCVLLHKSKQKIQQTMMLVTLSGAVHQQTAPTCTPRALVAFDQQLNFCRIQINSYRISVQKMSSKSEFCEKQLSDFHTFFYRAFPTPTLHTSWPIRLKFSTGDLHVQLFNIYGFRLNRRCERCNFLTP